MRCFLDFNYGKRAISKDAEVKFCFVERYNKFTKTFKKIKLFFIEFATLWDMEDFALRHPVDFIVKVQEVHIDDCSFDMRLTVFKKKKSKSAPLFSSPSTLLPVAA